MDQELVNPPFVAMVDGKQLTELPEDLFIPPDALEILLDSFSGPLDLLLYLIRKQNIDILNIPIVTITQQYLHYIRWMEYKKLELAADYLLMAATLAEIKSRMLLPSVPNSEEEEEEDPRLVLVQKLQAYEQIKQAAELIDSLPRRERDHFLVQIETSDLEIIKNYPEVHLAELMSAMNCLLQKKDHQSHHQVIREQMSVRERMSAILLLLQEKNMVELKQLFRADEGRAGLVVAVLATLELAKQLLVIVVQKESFSPIYLRVASQ